MRPARLAPLAAVLLAASAAAQTFELAPDAIPQGAAFNQHDTEQVDFGDVDLDGDWDVVLANGGDSGNEQNRIWINLGGLQGGTTGTFVDETAARLPAVADSSRDVELVDLDGDDDLDLYVANHSTFQGQPCRFWINVGGKQAGLLGHFVDETATRWVGLGGAGSSMPPSLVLAGGGFLDWSSDGDFADLDADGDLDLVHSSYGSGYAGNVPSRLFLNDGDGHFSEFNPSGHQLASSTISDGAPGLWVSGTQQSGTTDVTGAFCDIAATVVDLEAADLDGDLDLDVLLGSRSEGLPRYFENGLESGTLSFVDKSGALLPPGSSTGTFAYEQELGDLDGDGDLDLYGLNWAASLVAYPDVVLENVGGSFANAQGLSGSGADEEEGDFLDYDGDGDLDLYVASFSGQDQLYRNDGGFVLANVTASQLPASGLSGIARDAEAADLDGDGDADVMVAIAAGGAVLLLENRSDVPDAHAPLVPAVESVGVAAAQAAPLRVRASVVDNQPYYVTWHADVVLEATVEGVALPPAAMRSSGGQVFRGELPGHLVGAVAYSVRATDHAGNATLAPGGGWTATGASGTTFGTETAATGSAPPRALALSELRAGLDGLLAAEGELPGALAVLAVAAAPLSPAVPVPGLPGLVLNVDPGALLELRSGLADAQGDLVEAFAVPASAPGATVHVQAFEVAGDGTIGSSRGRTLTVQ